MVGFIDSCFQIAQHAECWVLSRFLTRTAVHRTVELVRDFAVEGDVDVVAGRVPRLLTSAEKLRDGDRGENAKVLGSARECVGKLI